MTIDVNEVGAHVDSPGLVRFGVYLPEITAAKGYVLVVRIIHERDQFTPEVPPKDFPLAFNPTHELGLWSTTVDVRANADTASHFGLPGRYLYRYRLLRTFPGQPGPTIVTSAFTDPFAIEAGPSKLAAFRIDDPSSPTPPFSFEDDGFQVPALDDLVVYELQVEEFNETFDGVIERLDYLEGLGVNALELMPITAFPQVFDWGYGPLHFFAPEDRWGGVDGLKRLVKACHKRGMAVILDVVYQHCSPDFAYDLVYKNSGETGPMGGFPDGSFGPVFTYENSPFTQQYVRAANKHWMVEHHVDGFRYDNVQGFYHGPISFDYANVVFQTYGDSAGLKRFGTSATEARRLIQVAEFLTSTPQTILIETYSNATWQDNLLNLASNMVQHGFVNEDFAHLLDPSFLGYPATRDFNGVPGPVAPFQYISTHDHSDFMANLGTVGKADDIPLGDRSRFWKTQPFAIALMTCQGIPMLWQGQEYGENYILPGSGTTRIQIRRDLHWDYFYDDIGTALIRVYRRLGKLRRSCPALRSRNSFYFFQNSNLPAGALAYQRHAPATSTQPEQYALVFLNFSDFAQTLSVPFPIAGKYREMLDDNPNGPSHDDLTISAPGQLQAVQIPSNYGRIYVTPVS